MSSRKFQLTVLPEFGGMRLDQWISDELSDLYSRTQVSRWIKSGHVIGPDAPLKSSRKIEEGEIYSIQIPETQLHDIEPVDLSLKILYEDKDIAVIVKPPGIPVHPGKGDTKTTLLNGIYYIWEHLKPTPKDFRPGIVHRLDAATEGILVIALNSNSLRKMSDQFKDRSVLKNYSAWLMAAPPEKEGRIELPLRRHPVDRLKMTVHESGKMAITSYRIEKVILSRKGRKYCLVDLNIETGRTHQIRVHMSHLGCPVVGDALYSRSYKEFEKFGLLLLARKIKFKHPSSGKEMEFEIDLPDRFHNFENNCIRF